jgi:hypothetical protein
MWAANVKSEESRGPCERADIRLSVSALGRRSGRVESKKKPRREESQRGFVHALVRACLMGLGSEATPLCHACSARPLRSCGEERFRKFEAKSPLERCDSASNFVGRCGIPRLHVLVLHAYWGRLWLVECWVVEPASRSARARPMSQAAVR